jgi:hypothetical protein
MASQMKGTLVGRPKPKLYGTVSHISAVAEDSTPTAGAVVGGRLLVDIPERFTGRAIYEVNSFSGGARH